MGDHRDIFAELVEIVSRVRSECPWDREQTHDTLKSNLIEETYEVVDAIESGDPAKLSEELGDLLMQVLLHAEMGSEKGRFSLKDVISGIAEKLVRRHPHVFGDLDVKDSESVLRNWERIKRSERSGSALDGVPSHMPALAAAKRLQEKASRVGFDWDDVNPALEKVREEISEMESAPSSEFADELGDVLFALVNVARLSSIDPEDTLRKANSRFKQRFQMIEEMVRAQGRQMESYSLEELDVFWEEAKKRVAR